MLYLTYGSDKKKTRDKHLALARSILNKQPEATFFKLSTENFSAAEFEELIFGQTLFVRRFVVAGDNLLKELKDKTAKEFILTHLADIAESENIFLFLEEEEALGKGASMEDKNKGKKRREEIEKLKKVAVKAQEFSVSPPSEFNIYSIVDAFAARNKNEAWLLYEEALLSGVAPEEVLWKIIWQVQNMLLVKKTKDEKELNLKPFVLGKTKRAAQKFEIGELEKLSGELVDLYHETYLGSEEFEFGLERVLLGV
jgi:DNA polymerase III gamma/tau subunit